MQKHQQHIIYSNSVELEFYNRKENLFIQNHIAELVKDKLLPAMETLFDEQAVSGKTIRIESLEIDLGKIDLANWEYSFVNETIYQLRQKLNEIVSFSTASEIYEVNYKNDQPLISNIQSVDEAINSFHYFLQRGTLPWNASGQPANYLLKMIVKASKNKPLSESQKRKIYDSIFYADETLKRFLLQFTGADLPGFFRHVLQATAITRLIDEYIKILAEEKPVHRSTTIAWLLALFRYYSENKADVPTQDIAVIASVLYKELSSVQPQLVKNIFSVDKKLVERLQQQGYSIQQHDLRKNSKPEKKETATVKDAGLQHKRPFETSSEHFINNAGLIILSPFLKQMFINLGLSTAKEFISGETQQHAVLLSQYLITGETEIAEHELLLNKVLCGYPIDKTLPAAFEVSEDEKKQCSELLQSVLEYWKELKTTSAGSLLNTYVLRNGKLVDKGESWLLQVEYKAVDIMLQFLPWSIGIIYLPWMQKRLMVEWRA